MRGRAIHAGLLIAVFVFVAGAAGWAQDLTVSLRPMPNPLYMAPGAAWPAAPASTNPDVEAALAAAADPSDPVLAVSLRPKPRPEALLRTAAAAPEQGLDLKGLIEPEPSPPPKGKKAKKKKAAEAETTRGSVCGVAAIKGEPIAPIKAKVKGCGLRDGVRVTSVSGVRLSQAATIDCDTARALNSWVREVVQPAYGGDVAELKIAAHYICRPRNNKKGAKISEHGRGKAIDIGGFVLDSGKVLTVAGDYNRKMRKVHKGACGIFGTTLGPGSDGYHEDHLHFDTAQSRSGPYCR